jgi:hypothetical protein
MVNQVCRHRFNAARPDQFRGLGFELRQLQDRDFGRIVHYARVYRNAVYSSPDSSKGNRQNPGGFVKSLL